MPFSNILVENKMTLLKLTKETMTISRRHFLRGTSAAAILLSLKSKPGEALTPENVGMPFGKNQIGLNGITYYSNIHPFTNWWKNGNRQQLDLTFKNGISSLTWADGVVTATTAVPHGLYQTVGNNSFRPLSITALNPAYNHSNSKFDCT